MKDEAGVTQRNRESGADSRPVLDVKKVLPAAAQRALAEAEARRKTAEVTQEALATEIGGRKEGLEPTRYGDWESKGLLSDF